MSVRCALLCGIAALLLLTFSWRYESPSAAPRVTAEAREGILRLALSRGHDVLGSARAAQQRRRRRYMGASTSGAPSLVEAVENGGEEGAAAMAVRPPPPAAAAVVASGAAAAASPVPLAAIARTLLSIDFHISPIQDLKHLLKSSFPGVTVADRSLSGACLRTGTCATDDNLKVLVRGDVDNSMYFGISRRQEFFEAYREGGTGGRLVLDSDAMVCSHPTGMCELAMPFNRSVILWATTRFEQGRERNRGRLEGYIKNFRALAALPGSVVLANNMYDVHYIHYFTGVLPRYVPSQCAYPGVQWSWRKGGTGEERTILVHGYRPKGVMVNSMALPPGVDPQFHPPMGVNDFLSPLNALADSGRTGGFRFRELRDALGNNYQYAKLASFPAILHLPYQVSIMSFFEHYRMGVPIIAPSLALLTKWHMDNLFVSERTWDTVLYGKPSTSSVLPRHPDADEPFDPNDEKNPAAVEWWLQWADYYTFPHIITFDSWEDLASKVAAADLGAISAAMLQHGKVLEEQLVGTWADVLRGIPKHEERAADALLAGLPFGQRMDRIYGAGNWAAY